MVATTNHPEGDSFAAQVSTESARLRHLKDTYGEEAGAVMFLTGLSVAEVDELGGI